MQSEDRERHHTGKPDDNNLPEFAADIIADLAIDLRPDLAHQLMLTRCKAGHPGDQCFFVLHHEENQDRHQDEINQDGNEAHHRRERDGKQFLPPGGELGADEHHDFANLLGRDDLGITLGQFKQHILTHIQHAGNLLYELCRLLRQQRQQSKENQHHKQQEGEVHHQHRDQPGQPRFFQHAHQALKEIGDHHRGEQGRQHVAHEDDDDKQQDQKQC